MFSATPPHRGKPSKYLPGAMVRVAARRRAGSPPEEKDFLNSTTEEQEEGFDKECDKDCACCQGDDERLLEDDGKGPWSDTIAYM